MAVVSVQLILVRPTSPDLWRNTKGARPRQPVVFTRTIPVCVAITWLAHVISYLLNARLSLHIVALGGSHGQIGWLFAVYTGIAWC